MSKKRYISPETEELAVCGSTRLMVEIPKGSGDTPPEGDAKKGTFADDEDSSSLWDNSADNIWE